VYENALSILARKIFLERKSVNVCFVPKASIQAQLTINFILNPLLKARKTTLHQVLYLCLIQNDKRNGGMALMPYPAISLIRTKPNKKQILL
jgi:hypothetical protein